MKPWQEGTLVAGLLLLFAGLVLGSSRRQSPTVDEFAHLPAGYYYWRTGDFSLYAKNPPLVKLIAALPWLRQPPAWPEDLPPSPASWRPWYLGTEVMRLNPDRYANLFNEGRAPILALAGLLGLCVWSWSRRLYGPAGGLVSLLGFCLCPEFLAHAGLATVDLGASLFIFAAVFAGLRFLDRPGPARALAAGILLGLAELSKFTALLLVPLFLLSPIVARSWQGRGAPDRGGAFSYRRFSLSLAALLLAAGIVLLAGYGFHLNSAAIASEPFRSEVFQSLQEPLSWLPALLPRDYLTGLDLQLHDSEVSFGEFPNYLFGQWYRGQKWYYFPVALAVKTPVPLLLGFGMALLLKRRASDRGRLALHFLRDEAALLVLLVWLFLGITGRNHLQIGVRYLLPLFPFALVLMGRLAALRWPSRWNRRWRVLLAGLGLWLLLGTLRVYPHFLAYFNEPAGGPDRGYQILLNSNLDWGQDLPGLADYLREHGIARVHLAYFGHADPALYAIQYDILQEPGRPGLTAISANYLMGYPYPITYTNPWSKIPPESTAPYQERKPLAKIGYSIFLFED